MLIKVCRQSYINYQEYWFTPLHVLYFNIVWWFFFSGDLMKQLSLPKKNYDFDPVL